MIVSIGPSYYVDDFFCGETKAWHLYGFLLEMYKVRVRIDQGRSNKAEEGHLNL